LELIFIRHGQGEHNLDVPDRLSIPHPKLTERGRTQVGELLRRVSFSQEDIMIVSPTRRTIETSMILAQHTPDMKRYINPAIGPRMFPQNPEWMTFICDSTMSMESIETNHAGYELMNRHNRSLWIEGINTVEVSVFNKLGLEMINWIKTQHTERAFLITHDGTINSYRQLLGEERLTRSDFLGEAGMYRVERQWR
jgi:broad specificity phosphatase PhoE